MSELPVRTPAHTAGKVTDVGINLRDIITEEFQEEIQDSFAYATGFGVVFIDTEGNHIGPGGNFTRFCTAINQREIGAKSCALTNRQAISLAMDNNQPSIYICHAGLVNIEIPLIIEGQHVGAITAGQVRTSEPDSYPRDTTPCAGNWMEDHELVEYYKEIKTLNKQQIEATTKALANISNFIIQRYAFNKMQEELLMRQHELLAYQKKQLETEHLLMSAKFDALQKQVTPHFVFNVINSVSRLIYLGENSTAQEMLSSFSGMMRYSLSNLQSLVPLDKELECIKNYLSIQKIRFDDRLSFSISCEESMRSLHVPFFSLQPLVENSLEHGLLTVATGGSVSINAYQDDSGFCIDIVDDGVGFEPGILQAVRESMETSEPGLGGSSVGLFNSYNRFRLMYGKAFTMSIDSNPRDGTSTWIRISTSE